MRVTPKSPAAARVLVASDEAKEARQLVELLQNHFDHVGHSPIPMWRSRSSRSRRPTSL
jgi:hypothetical protein